MILDKWLHCKGLKMKAESNKGFIFVGISQANNIFLHKKSAAHFSTVGITI